MGKSVFKKLVLPGFIIFIMVMSGVGYMFGRDSSEIIKYNNYRFSKVQDGWLTYISDRQIVLFNNPEDLSDVDIDYIDFAGLNSAEKIYISSNPQDNLGVYLQGLQFNLLNNLNAKKVFSCYEDNEDCADFPLKNCSDASDTIKVILIKKGETEITYKDNCLLVQGKDEELVKYIDKFVLNMFIYGKNGN